MRKGLTALRVKRIRKPGRHMDGDGLYLAVSETGAKSWVFMWKRNGKRHAVGLGSAEIVSLADARDSAAERRKVVRTGGIPLSARAAKVRAAAGVATFGAMADELFESLSPSWRNAKHRYQWKRTLEVHCQSIRHRAVAEIAVEDVLRVLKPLWTSRVETALRTRARIERVLDFAKAKQVDGMGEKNAAAWKGNLAALLPAPPSKRKRVQHLRALPYDELPGFIGKLRNQDGVAARALEFDILTAARPGETAGARWREINFTDKAWAVPGERMKAGLPHRVPLSKRAVAILREMEKGRVSEFVFPGLKDGKPLSDMALTQLLRRMGIDVTAHGFRSSFRDWCGDCTHFPREVAEAALAHLVGDEVERAYRRGDALDKRRELMVAWANYCEPKVGNVVQMRRRK
jgi:integrase